jgi:hypothetical protein
MSPHAPFSLSLFVADGDPDCLRIVDMSNWICTALVFPGVEGDRPTYIFFG